MLNVFFESETNAGNILSSENENIFASIQLYQSTSLHLHNGIPCYVPNTRIHKISEDLQRESNIHQQQ